MLSTGRWKEMEVDRVRSQKEMPFWGVCCKIVKILVRQLVYKKKEKAG